MGGLGTACMSSRRFERWYASLSVVGVRSGSGWFGVYSL